MPEKVEITVDKLNEISDALVIAKQVDEEVKKLKAGKMSDEEFEGKVTALVQAQLDETQKALRAEAESKISFEAGRSANDPCGVRLQKAAAAASHREKQGLWADALTHSTHDENIKALQELNDEVLIIDAVMKSGVNRDRYLAGGGMRSLDTFARYQQAKDAAVGPMDTTDTAFIVPTAMSAQIIDLPVLYGEVENLFEHLPCPTKSYQVPIDVSGSMIADLISEATTNTNNPGDTLGHQIVDGQLTFTAKKLRGRLITSAELDEDSIIAWIPYIRNKLAFILGNTVEAAILNGDTTGTHMDTDINALGATDGRKAWKGLRRLTLGVAGLDKDCTSGDINEANMLAVKALCGKYGVKPKDGAWIVGPGGLLTYMLKLDGVVKLYEYGPQATVKTGELVQYMGSPVIVSEHCREDTTTAGINGVSGNTKKTFLYVNHRYWYVGDRRMVTLAAEPWITTDQINLVAFRRLDFQPVATPSATISIAALGYNIA